VDRGQQKKRRSEKKGRCRNSCPLGIGGGVGGMARGLGFPAGSRGSRSDVGEPS